MMTVCFKSRITINPIPCTHVPLKMHIRWTYEWLESILVPKGTHSPEGRLAGPQWRRQAWMGSVQETQLFPIQTMVEGAGRSLGRIPQAGSTAPQNFRPPICPGLGKSHTSFLSISQAAEKRETEGGKELKLRTALWYDWLPCQWNYYVTYYVSGSLLC